MKHQQKQTEKHLQLRDLYVETFAKQVVLDIWINVHTKYNLDYFDHTLFLETFIFTFQEFAEAYRREEAILSQAIT